MTGDHAWDGVYAVAITPFTAEDAVDEEGIEQLVSRLVDEGVGKIVVGGNTAEFFTLSEDELACAVERTVAAGAGRASVVVGVGHEIGRARRAARRAEQAGAVALMIHHPAHPYLTEEGLVGYYTGIADSVTIPILPYVKSPVLGAAGFERLSALASVPAVKYAVADPIRFGEIVAAGPAPVRWICGLAESWAPAFWGLGASGFTSGLVNVAPRVSLELYEKLVDGDRDGALECWRRVRPFEQLRSRGADGWNVSVVKEALRQLGLPAGHVRPPSSEVGADEARAIAEFLAVAVPGGAPARV